jgi:hypothetical protein
MMADTPSSLALLRELKDHHLDGPSERRPGNTSQESRLDLFGKYQRERGQWNEAQGKAHIATGTLQTLCQKNCRPDAPSNGTISARGWKLHRGRLLREVTCASCLAALDRASVCAASATTWQDKEEARLVAYIRDRLSSYRGRLLPLSYLLYVLKAESVAWLRRCAGSNKPGAVDRARRQIALRGGGVHQLKGPSLPVRGPTLPYCCIPP